MGGHAEAGVADRTWLRIVGVMLHVFIAGWHHRECLKVRSDFLIYFFSLPFAMEKEHGQVGPVFGGVTVGRVLPETWPILFNCILQLFHFES